MFTPNKSVKVSEWPDYQEFSCGCGGKEFRLCLDDSGSAWFQCCSCSCESIVMGGAVGSVAESLMEAFTVLRKRGEKVWKGSIFKEKG